MEPTSDPRAELEHLRQENAQLRARLSRVEGERAAAKGAGVAALKTGGKLLLPMFDRQKVVRSGMDLFEVASGYTDSREQWPSREDLLAKSREFALSLLRFTIRRRMFMVAISLLAFLVPLVQVWLVFQQNAIIENQDKYFNIQVYDIVARSLTSQDSTAKQITAALLAREDFTLVNGIISAVFEAQGVGAFTADDVASARPVLIEETAARGHLVSALVLGIDRHADDMSTGELWDQVEPTFRLVASDAAARLPQLLRLDRKEAFRDPAVGRDCYRYLFALSTLMRRADALAREEGEEAAYFEALGPALARVSQVPRTGSAFTGVFVTAMQELLLDLALKPDFGDRSPEVAPNELKPKLQEGLDRLVEQTKAHARGLREARLRELLEVGS